MISDDDYYHKAYVPIRFCSDCPYYVKFVDNDKTLKDKLKRWLGFEKDKRLYVEVCTVTRERVERIGKYGQSNLLFDFKCPYKKCNQNKKRSVGDDK